MLLTCIVLQFTLLSLVATVGYQISVKFKNAKPIDHHHQPCTLQERSDEHDQSLPSYPRPSLATTIKEIVRLSSILEDAESHSHLVRAINHHDPAIEAAFEKELSLWASRKVENWTTEKKRTGLLMPRKPLCAQCMVTTLPNLKQNSISATAANLLHTIAVVFTSPRIISIIGSDGKNKEFETRQLVEVFATNRVPATKLDKIQTFAESRHVIVWARSQPYQVEVIDSRGQPIAKGSLESSISQVLASSSSSSSSSKAPAKSVASLSTSLNRDSWAHIRDDLVQRNPTSMYILESAISSIALELNDVDTEAERLNMTRGDTGNVYSDKTMTWSVFPDGGISSRVDHSVADGGLIGRLLQVYLSLMTQNAQRSFFEWFSSPPADIPSVKPIEICLGTLDASQLNYNVPQGYEQQTLFSNIPFDRTSLSSLRKTKLLNFTVQLAFQAALIRVLDTTNLLILEPTSVRQFAGGRSDPNFIVTAESISFCKALSIHQSFPQLAQKFEEAYTRYLELQRQAKTGSSISAGISFLGSGVKALAPARERSVILQTLNKIQNPIYFTGAPVGPALEFFEAYIFTDNQLSVVYVGHTDRVLVSIAGSGKYRGLLPLVQKHLEECIFSLTNIALSFGAGKVERT